MVLHHYNNSKIENNQIINEAMIVLCRTNQTLNKLTNQGKLPTIY